MQKINDLCPHCKKDYLKLTKGNEPYSIDHLTCPDCGSTFNLDNIDKFKNNPEKITEDLITIDLGINFNGYPLEGQDADEMVNYLSENQCKRFHKNKRYKLVMRIEEVSNEEEVKDNSSDYFS